MKGAPPRTMRAAFAGLSAAVLILVAGCSSDDDNAVVSSPASSTSSATTNPTSTDSTSTAPDTSEPVDTEPATSEPATTEPSTDEPTTEPTTGETVTSEPATTEPLTSAAPTTQTATTTPRISNWQVTTDEFPELSYDACCGSDWEGEPSPPVPADAAAPLATGIYDVDTVDGAEAGATDENFLDGALTLELRPYQPCGDLGEFECSGNTSVPDALGVSRDPARVIDIALDESLRVAISGFECADDQLLSSKYTGDGNDLDALIHELDASYETAIVAPLRAGTPAEQVADDIAASSPNGFFKSDCPSYTQFAWRPSSGPTIIVYPNLTTFEGQPPPTPLRSAAADWLRPTALEIDDAGQMTLYIYAGFSS